MKRRSGTRKRRALLLVENNGFPADPRVRQQADALLDAGWNVSVIAPRNSGQRRKEHVNGVSVRRFRPVNGSGARGTVLEYAVALASMSVLAFMVRCRRRVDVVHLSNPPDFLILIGLGLKLLGAKIVFDVHDPSPELFHRLYPDGNQTIGRVLMALERLSCRRADHVITTNESLRSLVVSRHGLSPDSVTVVRNGPSLDLFSPDPPSPGHSAESVAGRIVYVGAMGHQDGVENLVAAMALMPTAIGVECLLIGDGPARADLERQAAALGVDGVVRFLGAQPFEDVPDLIASADVCVAPEVSDGYHERCTVIKLMEYMAMAKPIVAFDLPEHRVTVGSAAVLVPSGDHQQMADALGLLLQDPQRGRMLGLLGRQRVEDSLAWRHQATIFCQVYNTI